MKKMKKMGKLYGNVDKKGDMKKGGKASNKAVSATFALLLTGMLLLALALLPPAVLAATPVTTCHELQDIRNNLTGDYYLANDINCSGIANFKPIGNDGNKFTGTFDGKGYKITHVYINRPYTDYVGLFGCTGSGSEIKNASLEEVDVCGENYVGGLVGTNKGTITNSYSTGTVSGLSYGSNAVGGLVGGNEGTITNCYSTGTVSSGTCAIGGLAGGNSGIIKNSYSTGTVSSDLEYAGGLVGYNDGGTIKNCYSTGRVSGPSYVGGLVGQCDLGEIKNCYSTGRVSGSSYVGGLVGWYSGMPLLSCWDIYRSNQNNCVGYNDHSDVRCIGKNAGNSEPDYWYYSAHAPMDKWDFNNIWGIAEGVTYPYLRWQYAPAPDITSFAPPSPVNDLVYNWRTFNVTVDQTVNVSWYLNGSLLFTNESVRDASCRIHADAVGVHNVSAIASNANGTDMQTWIWNVTIPLNCTCGDVCVNEMGWWQDGGTFNPSDTPIQDGIDNANAGETICVKDGIYTENVNVNKSLTIHTENGSTSTTVHAANSDDHVFEVTADYVNIRGFTVTGATGGTYSAGIYLNNVKYCNIFDNSASKNGYAGIFLDHASHNELTSNTVTSNNNAYGIAIDCSSHNVLTYNTASNNNNGIYLEMSCNNTITGNTATSNGYSGILLDYSSDNLIYNNYFNNTHNAYDNGNNRWNIAKTAGTNIIGGPYLGGNYWSDYAGMDTDGDGLGDTLLPYNSSGNITKGGDYHPLVRVPGEELPVTTPTPSYVGGAGRRVTPTPGPMLTPIVSPTPTPIPTPTVTPTPTPPIPVPTPSPTPTPKPFGFEAGLAIAGLLAVAYLVLRRRK